MYCPYCGVELQDDSVFCHSCGKRLLSVSSEIDVAEDMPIAEEPKTAVMAEQKARITHSKDKTDQNTKKQAKKPFIAVACLLILIVVALVIILPSNHVKKNAESVLYLELYDDTNTIIGSASGFLIHDDTTLVTNYHVIDGTYHIRVKDANGKKYTTADTILAYDEDLDLAILQCDEGIGVAPLPLGNSAAIKQGDKVFAVGYPLGLANTLSEGIVSSLYSDGGTDTIQTTAAISGGSSGGALLNDRGEVIGVTAASYEDGQNLNLAIPINYVSELFESIDHSHSVALDTLYTPTYSVDFALENTERLDSKYAYVQGYISSIDYGCEYNGTVLSPTLYLVSTEDDVLGYTFQYGASWDYSGNNRQGEDMSRYLRNLCLRIDNIDREDLQQYSPGDYVSVLCSLSEGVMSLTSAQYISISPGC